MTTIYANGAFIDESRNPIESADDLPVDGNVTVPLELFLEAPETYLQRGENTAVLIAAGEKAEALRPHLERLSLVIVAFPKFTDGRGFSAARILREELGYRGDIRAAGDYILDQVPLMRRCGISSFEISKPEVVKALKDGEWPEVTRYLQPVGTVEEIPAGTRPWARRSLRQTAQAAE
ncbi:DUF934 domain-containing protein [Roseibium sp.]|uniref:DUF934 domain-containing protein n=1 Tax=Roseibium sp. TaxID=1936156 RepID=UPI003A96FC44